MVTTGAIKVVFIEDTNASIQFQSLLQKLHLVEGARPFTRCIECNHPLLNRTREEVRDLVPPYVVKTQQNYRQCPGCQRIYWWGPTGRKWPWRLRGWEHLARK